MRTRGKKKGHYLSNSVAEADGVDVMLLKGCRSSFAINFVSGSAFFLYTMGKTGMAKQAE